MIKTKKQMIEAGIIGDSKTLEFYAPLGFEWLTGKKVLCTFTRGEYKNGKWSRKVYYGDVEGLEDCAIIEPDEVEQIPVDGVRYWKPRLPRLASYHVGKRMLAKDALDAEQFEILKKRGNNADAIADLASDRCYGKLIEMQIDRAGNIQDIEIFVPESWE